ncbi:13378_t:CDS:2, partial [Racocetra fulgida]
MLCQGEAFHEITKHVSNVKEILDEEEESFSRTLDRGEKLFDTYLQKAKQNDTTSLPGADVWRLYDTYGFPVDLTRLMAEENGLGVDEQGFLQEQEKAKEISRNARNAGADDREIVALDMHDIAKIEQDKIANITNDNFNIKVTVKGIYYNHSFFPNTDDIPSGKSFGIILDRTNFYAEQGGQQYDSGFITIDTVDAQAEFEAIHGLRAVFGEVYPDPVRVVSIGYDVNDIVQDVSNPKWVAYSFDLFKLSHVAKTGDIKGFIILEESGIAKGIRRIVAVTGEEAQQAIKVADEFRIKIDNISKLQGAELDSALKLVSKELDASNISSLKKSEYHKAAYLFSIDETSSRVAHSCIVGKSLIDKGLKAVDWAKVVSESVGGKSGGKDDAAQGSGTNVGEIDNALKVAEQFAKLQ